MERRTQGRFSKFDNPTIIYTDGQGIPHRAYELARLFVKRPEERQAELAYRCVDKYHISPDYVLSWITGDSAKTKFELWCYGKNIPLKKDAEERDNPTKVPHYLAADTDLIDKLSPHLKQIDLARILAIRRYRETDEEAQQYLVYGVYRLVGSYLGPRRYYRREPQTATLLPLPDLPIDIFEDDLITNILYGSEREAAVPIFNKSKEEGFRYLAEMGATAVHPLQRAFIERLVRYSGEVVDLYVPGFKTTIAGSQKDLPIEERTIASVYPSYHQKEFAYRFAQKPIKADLLIGDTGTMKTGAFIYTMGAIGAKSPLVVCPPGLIKDNWEREIQEKYEEDVEIVKINSERDLKALANKPIDGRQHYVILPYSILSRLSVTPETADLVTKLISNCSIDALGADEIHLAKEYSATCTQLLYMISRALPKGAPRIAMTATGVVNRVEDLDAPVRILRPYDYPNPGDFTRAARNDPTLVSALLHGQGLLTRWTAEGILGEELPETEYHDEPVPLSYFHQALYEYVYKDSTIEAQVKRGMLRQVSLDPLLIRRHYHPNRIQEMMGGLRAQLDLKQNDRDRQIIGERIRALEERLVAVTNLCNPVEALRQLEEAYSKYTQWRSKENPDEKFNENFLIRLGYDSLVLWAFLNLSTGLDSLVKGCEITQIKTDWEHRDGIYSSKYQKLKEILDELLFEGKTKVIIGSGFYQHEVTTGIEDLSEDDELAFLSLYDHLRSWYGYESVLKIDGSVSLEPKRGELAEREQARRAWRLNPNKKILLQTIRASRLGIDLTIPLTEANKDIEKVVISFLDEPDTYADKVQFVGRVRRKGQKIPIEVVTLKTTNLEHPSTFRYGFIDHGISEALEFKQLLSQMVLDGVPLTEEEERKVRAHLSHLRINLYPETPRAYLYTRVFPSVRGKGFKGNREFFGQVGFEGLTNADFFSIYYSDSDELALPGHNAKAVAEVIRKYQMISGIGRPLIGSIGAGAGILQLTLGQRIVNVDMLPEILEVARSRNSSEGYYAIADASRLSFKDNAFDITDASLMLHWTNNNPNIRRLGIYLSERAIVLQELNRVTKYGGLATITLPHPYLTGDQFGSWVTALEQNFGFKLRLDLPSGLVRAIDFRNEPISWIFNLEKIAEPILRFDPSSIALDFERIVDIIGKSRVTGPHGDQAISISPLLPHQEFEVVQPNTGKIEKISYTLPSVEEDIDRILGGVRRPFSSGIQVAVELDGEEFGLYRRLIKEAKRVLGLNNRDAEKLALDVINVWHDSGNQKHDIHRIWSELKVIMQEVNEERK